MTFDLDGDEGGDLDLDDGDSGGLLTLGAPDGGTLLLDGGDAPALDLAGDVGGSFTIDTTLGTGPQGQPGRDGEPGPQGPPGQSGNVGVTVEALVNLNAYTVVKVMGTGQARPASSNILGDGEATTGVTTAAALAGEQVPIRTVGAINVAGTLPVGPLYLGTDGALTPNHDSGLFQLRVGYAQTPNLLVVRIDPPIYNV